MEWYQVNTNYWVKRNYCILYRPYSDDYSMMRYYDTPSPMIYGPFDTLDEAKQAADISAWLQTKET